MSASDVFVAGGGELGELIRSMPDSATAQLGPPATWPHSLRTVLRLMLSSRYAMWLGWGPDLTFFYNDTYRDQTLGPKHPWALGKSAREVWAEIWHTIGPRIDHVLSTGEATWDEGLLLFLERHGFPEETYHTFSYSPAPRDDGQVAGLFCVVIEETERVIGERRLALLRDLALHLGATIAIADVMSALERCLVADTREFPFSITYLFDERGSTARRTATTIIAPTHAAAPETIDVTLPNRWWPLRELFLGAGARIVLLDPSGDWPVTAWGKPPSHAVVVPIAQPGQDAPAGVFIAGLNPYRPVDDGVRSFAGLVAGQLGASISNARALEEEKRRAEALAEIDRAKTTFFSNVSHEFRTPLTLMLGPLEDALATAEKALGGENLEMAHRNALRLLRLVNALLDFSRIEAGRVQASYERTDVGVLTSELASVFRSAVERAGLRLVVDVRPIDAPVFVDREMWEKIVLNLLSNALKFTFHGQIAVGIRAEGAHAVLTVEDTGIGVAAAEMPHLFERFHRVHGAKARTHEGSGIGLALVSELVKLHGGEVRVTSVEGKGTAFEIRVPTGTAHLAPEKIVVEQRTSRGARAAAPFVEEALRWLPPSTAAETTRAALGSPVASAEPVSDARAVRIVVADDNADMREYVTRLLSTRWRVEAVGDGLAALEAVRREPPALVLSDVMMPGLDGFGLVQALRSDPATRTIPVILLSARAGEESTSEGLQAGANDYLIKPFSARELVARVASQLAIAAVREESERTREAQRRIIETLFDEAPAAIALLRGPDLVIEFANARIVEVWQRTSASQVVGKPLLDAMPELRGQGFDTLLHRVMASGEPFFGSEVAATFVRDGHEITRMFNFVYVPTRDADGVVDGASVFAFDVTAQVDGRARAELGSRVGRALVTNESLAEQLRHSCEAIVSLGATVARIWVYDPGHALFDLRASAAAGGEPLGDAPLAPFAASTGRLGEPMVLHRDADHPEAFAEEWITRAGIESFAGHPLFVGERLVGVVELFAKPGLSGDLSTALASIADPIALGIDRDAIERFRELFIGMLGHDLRNPLNAILMATHVLTPAATDAQRRTLKRVDNSARRMERMITQVLDFTRARSGGGIPLVRARVSLRQICESTIEELASAHPDRAVELRVSGNADGSWDADRMAQVFSNLISNALAYRSAGSPVEVAIDASESHVRVTVRNVGPPIPAELLPRLFDPFRRALHAKMAGTQGLGLGLFITREIVTAHGGSISVHSNASAGTIFTVILPKEAASA